MRKQEPIRDQSHLDVILSFIKERSVKYYIMIMFTLHTGACLSDIVQTRISDCREVHGTTVFWYFCNPKNNIRFLFDEEFTQVFTEYCRGLDSAYLFPKAGDNSTYASSPSIFNRICGFSAEMGDHFSFVSFQKTFALNYFREHKTLVPTGLCRKYYGKAGIMRYFNMSEEEYDSIINEDIRRSSEDVSAIVRNVEFVRNKTNDILDDYIEELTAISVERPTTASVSRSEKFYRLLKNNLHIYEDNDKI